MAADHETTEAPGTDGSSAAAFDEKNKKTTKVLLAIIVGMFLVGFASIPLYRMFCAAVDPGGSAAQNGSVDEYKDGTEIDTSRTVRVRFATNVEKQLPWTFRGEEDFAEVHPGEKRRVMFYAKNLDPSHEIKGKGVYDINPPEAGQYFKKIECFCFTEQTLGPDEDMDMPLVFWFEPDMPADITNVTIAYTFFNVNSSLTRSMEKRAEAPRGGR